jgi:hypothetical protein
VKGLGTWALVATLVATTTAAPAYAQAAARRLTTIDGLRRFSSYFHLQNVAARRIRGGRQRVVLRGGDTEMQVMLNDIIRRWPCGATRAVD